MSTAKTILKPDSIHPFSAESRVKGWVGSGFAQRITEIQVRRVERDGVQEVQIELGIIEFKGAGERMYRHSAGMTLDTQQAEVLIQALQNVKTY